MGKTATGKWHRLVKLKIQEDINARIPNPRNDLTLLLQHELSQIQISQAILDDIYVLLLNIIVFFY